jgi:hypothetical protein
LLEIIFGHHILNIYLRHLFTKVWEECINQKRITVVAVLWHLVHKNVYFAAVRRKYRRRCNGVTCTSSVKGNIFVMNMVIAVLSSHGNKTWKLWSHGVWCCIAWSDMTSWKPVSVNDSYNTEKYVTI